MDLEQQKINLVISQFFSIFNNKDGAKPNGELIHSLLTPKATITRVSSKHVEVYNIQEFIEPRIKMLTDGTLNDFSEWKTKGTSEIFGQIAHHNCNFEKQGILNGQSYQGSGTKLFHLVKVDEPWKISSLIWQDHS